MSVEKAAQLLARARSALFITGAGISAASGIPTYRGIGGLYGDRPAEEGLAIEDVLSGEMMRDRPAITWKYIHQIERACRGATFNAAHAALATLEARLERAWVLTQNVDGLHAAAGSRRVIDIHGDIHHLICTACAWDARVADYATLAELPRCERCGAVVRPDVVLFGELLPSAKLELLDREMNRGFDVVVSIGTSSLFPYISRPVMIAKFKGWATIEINPERTEISREVDVRLPMPAVEALGTIVDLVERGAR
jgi:NAD-dependent deacetylase